MLGVSNLRKTTRFTTRARKIREKWQPRKDISENKNAYVEKDHNFGTAHRLCVGMR